jgi:hypothetical protein
VSVGTAVSCATKGGIAGSGRSVRVANLAALHACQHGLKGSDCYWVRRQIAAVAERQTGRRDGNA